MDVKFAPPVLSRLDSLRTEAFAACISSDRRPLGGALGLIDWRLCGQVSRLLVRGHVTGERSERTLVGCGARLPFDKLLLFGFGPTTEFDEAQCRAAVAGMLETFDRAELHTVAMVLPGRGHALIDPIRAMEVFLDVAGTRLAHDEVVLIDEPEAERMMMPVVERERRRARALLSP